MRTWKRCTKHIKINFDLIKLSQKSDNIKRLWEKW